jgi:putative hydrolase of HD superfamily
VSADRLEAQLRFIVEVDKLKHILRQSVLTCGQRHENDAEHSWHLALMAVLLGEYASEEIDLLRVVKMVLVHDLVEIDAGDTYCYDDEAARDKAERELAAAERIFILLPPDQAAEVRALWDEFEAMDTPESRFAAALDRLQPLLLNYHTQGLSWREHGIVDAQVLERNCHMQLGAPTLWAYAEGLIRDAVDKGYLGASED